MKPPSAGKQGALHEPSAETRRTVSVLSAVGTKFEVIARAIGVSVPTLRKHYRGELDDGKEIANGRVAETLYQMAISGRVPVATFFWLKTQAGWRETNHVEHSGEIATTQVSDEQRLAAVVELLERARKKTA